MKAGFLFNRNLDDFFYFYYFLYYSFLASRDAEVVIQRVLIGLLSRFRNVVVAAQGHIQFSFRGRRGQFPFVRVDMAEGQAQYAQLQSSLPKLQVAVLLVIRVDREGYVFFALQNILHQLGQHVSGPKFYEDAAAGLVDVFNLLFEEHRIQYLLFQDGMLLVCVIRIRLPGGVGVNRDDRLVEVLGVHKPGKGFLCVFHTGSVKSRRDRQGNDRQSFCL